MDASRAIEIVLRGGVAHGLRVSIMRYQLHMPMRAQGWPHAYQWHLDEDVDDEGRPVFRCDVPMLLEFNFVVDPRTIDTCMFDMIAFVEKEVRQRFTHPATGSDKVHIHWEGIDDTHEVERIDPRMADLSRYTMLKCRGVVIRDRFPTKEDPAA